MREDTGNLWAWPDPVDARCITTNGFVGKDLRCAMGRGVAKQARLRYPGVDRYLGVMIKDHGNFPYILLRDIPEGGYLVSFPVKHNWWEKADLSLIEISAHNLMLMIGEEKWQSVLLPRPGCGNGQLSWDEVKPVIEPILDDRVIVITDEA